MTTFRMYRLTCDAICLGERKKKGTYRSTITTIPYSQIVGALEARWGRSPEPIHAVGYFTHPDPGDPVSVESHTETHVFSRRDLVTGVAVLPIETQILTRVRGDVLVVRNDFTASWAEDAFEISMGAYRVKGLGNCTLRYTRDLEAGEVRSGYLRTRIPEDLLPVFDISEVLAPEYGYLFRPDEQREGGAYVRALFEGSQVVGPSVLLA